MIQRQLGHSNLGITSIYVQGIDNAEIIETIHARHAPMIHVSTLLAADVERSTAKPPPLIAHRSTVAQAGR